MRSVWVKTNSAEYPVQIQPNLLDKLARQIQLTCGNKTSVFVVTSPQIWDLWKETFLASFQKQGREVHLLFVPPGERHKRLSTVERLSEELSNAGAKRDTLLVAFGGGVIGDLTGFLAAIYMRGVRYAQIPTTYLAQIDSSVGGKTGVNLRTGKNLVGSFHHPVAVFCDPAILSTLPERELRAGLVEALKAAVLADASYFGWLERNLDKLLEGNQKFLTESIQRSVKIKAEIVGADEHESGTRMLLNLGHTVGHAIEAVTGYRSLLHGEAIAWGILAAISLSLERSVLSASEATRIEDLLFRLGPFPRFRASATALLDRTAADKKHLQKSQRFVLPVTIGRAVVVEDVTPPELLAAIQSMLGMARERGV
ncbi:MAG TPA: 3-dehydroquinate synthase [Acidobacteriaceae bacterium]|nr:3-dehydroquinate synthase [Acidobacteriaceae bacterium]